MSGTIRTLMEGEALWRVASLRGVEAAHAADDLMARAGAAAAGWAQTLRHEDLPVLLLAGPGNNGGDAFVAARLLRTAGVSCQLVFLGEAACLPPDAARAHRHFLAAGGVVDSVLPAVDSRFGLVVDGLFGIGLTRPLTGLFAEAVARANALAQRNACPLLALDCPSGFNADTGAALGEAVICASHTLTFLGAKPGLFTADAPDGCGEIRVADLGVSLAAEAEADGFLIAHPASAALFAPRRKNSHKGRFGTVGVLGGAAGMTGALLLAGRAALKLGAGRVLLGVLDVNAPKTDFVQPELMLRPASVLLDGGVPLTALACGPGMGCDQEAACLLARAVRMETPLLLDADALNLLAADTALAEAVRARVHVTLLTPHPLEAARLLQVTVAEVQRDRVAAAAALAVRYDAVVVLKGCGSIVAAPDGRWRINAFGNSGLATAGSGDVLSGIAATLLAQQDMAAFESLQAAVALHGLAAEYCVAAGNGPVGLTAGELIEAARRIRNMATTGRSATSP
ncbi:MAG: NAD(P)H-hydrate dehydratase [Zoogloeaceae bacterium]|jgi:hydroxyethylthiazole kinase-like uncharacterized protein yjeF|nr:NAD(P)H-hydrate dehydratase [Zoogloeaceae bacterium]